METAGSPFLGGSFSGDSKEQVSATVKLRGKERSRRADCFGGWEEGREWQNRFLADELAFGVDGKGHAGIER